MSEHFIELRKKVGHDTILTAGTGAIVVNDDGEVLLMLPSDTNEWGLPRGFMDLDETVLESLRRALRDQLGLRSSGEQLFGIYSGSAFDVTHANGDQAASVSAVFIVRSYTGKPENIRSSRELRFVSVDNLPSPMNRESARVLRDYADYSNGGLDLPHIL